MRSMKELAKAAIQVQDACNLSGVVHSFSQALTELRDIARAEGWNDTDKINQHHISVLYTDKIASLCSPGSSISGLAFSRAYEWASDQ